MKIGELARLAQCQPMTIRYYEKIGLMPAQRRTDSNYRVYDAHDHERLRFILHCREQRLPLQDIRALLRLREGGESSEAEIKDIIRRHTKQMREQIAALTAIAERLEELLADKGSLGHAAHVGQHLLHILSEPCPQCPDYDKDLPGDGHLLLHRAP